MWYLQDHKMGKIRQFIIGDILWQVTVTASLMQAWEQKAEITNC
jgi:hypothetical protein